MEFLNLHHLRYFRVIAREGSLGAAARVLRVSAPALSVQLKQLEESLGHQLFDRGKAGLRLTEAGRLALEYADVVGKAGEELMDVMRHRPVGKMQVLRVGVVATLSRNFILGFLRPVLHREGVEVVIRSGGLGDLLGLLRSLQVDLVLSQQEARADAATPWHCHPLASEPVALVGTPAWKKRRLRFPASLDGLPVILPPLETAARVAFDRMAADAGARPRVIAEVDDMALLRLLAREGEGLALVPPVVVVDEIRRRELVAIRRFPEIRETFYAIAPTRRFPNPLVAELLGSRVGTRRGMPPPGRPTHGREAVMA